MNDAHSLLIKYTQIDDGMILQTHNAMYGTSTTFYIYKLYTQRVR